MKKIFLNLVIVFTLAACGGSDGGTNGDGNTMPPVVPLIENGEIILDNYQELFGMTAFVNNVSSVDAAEYASAFSLMSNASIDQISWVGGLGAQSSAVPTNATFIIRIYDSLNGEPDVSSVIERTVSASTNLTAEVGSGNGIFGDLYAFNISMNGLFNLTAGDYFIAILDPETEGIDFRWTRQLNTPRTGGVFRSSSSSSTWIEETFGRNVRIVGDCVQEC